MLHVCFDQKGEGVQHVRKNVKEFLKIHLHHTSLFVIQLFLKKGHFIRKLLRLNLRNRYLNKSIIHLSQSYIT